MAVKQYALCFQHLNLLFGKPCAFNNKVNAKPFRQHVPSCIGHSFSSPFFSAFLHSFHNTFLHTFHNTFRSSFLNTLLSRVGNIVLYVSLRCHVILVFDSFFGRKGSNFRCLEQAFEDLLLQFLGAVVEGHA